jgi:GNAT superfamily N-acetyltransferase
MSHSDTVAFEFEPDPRDLAFLEERMAQAAVSAVGVGEEEEFAVVVRDDERIVAGASGAMWGGGCQVHVLWVDDTVRHQGLGRHLMAEVEHHARERGCRLVMGLTYDILIGDFYERLGYRTVGLIEDCPAGTSTRWYRKDLYDDQIDPS